MSPNALSPVEQLIHTTVRIECQTIAGGTSTGTGFIYKFCEQNEKFVPVIITNKHVVENAATAKIHFTKMNSEGEPIYGQHVPLFLNDFERYCVPHPDPEVDIAAFPIGALLNNFISQNQPVFWRAFSKSELADEELFHSLSPMEEITMIGYPIGLWDSVNNLPVLRRGITATPLFLNYNGRTEFLIDAACFPGSSGSPVLLCNIGSVVDKFGGASFGASRIKLLGVLYAGPQLTSQGEIRIVNVPTESKPVSVTKIPVNIGCCIKANRILELEPHFAAIADKPLTPHH